MKFILRYLRVPTDNNNITDMSTGLSAKPNEEVSDLACAIVNGLSISPQIQTPAVVWLARGGSWCLGECFRRSHAESRNFVRLVSLTTNVQGTRHNVMLEK